MAVFLNMLIRSVRDLSKKRTIKGRKRRKSREKQIYYGMALLAALFVVIGLTSAIRGGTDDVREASKVIQDASEGNLKKEEEKEEEEKAKSREKAAKNPDIRVLVMTNRFKGTVHPEVKLFSETGMTVTYDGGEKQYKKGKTLKLKPDHKWLKKGTVRVKAADGKVAIKS